MRQIPSSRFLRLLLGILFVATATSFGCFAPAVCSAQAVALKERLQPPDAKKAGDEDDEEEDVADAPNGQGNMFVMDRDRWEESLYSSFGGSKSQFEQNYRRKVRIILNRIDLICNLSEELRLKVQATADLETQRLEAEVDGLLNEAPKRSNQQQYIDFQQKLWGAVNAFQNKTRKFGIDSDCLWRKVLVSQLSAEQMKQIREDEQKRTDFRSDLQRLEVLMQLSRRLGLTSQQRDKLDAISKTKPSNWVQFESVWAMLQQYPESEKRNLFTAQQLQTLKEVLEVSTEPQLIMGFDQQW